MKKTGSQVEADIYRLVKTSAIATAISGGVYRDGTRPKDSKLEDAIVIFITALDGQNQFGEVNINIYVPQKSFTGSTIKDLKRCTELEVICQQFFDSLPTNNYLFSLGGVIYTGEQYDIDQHYVNVKLRFKYNTL